MARFDHDALQRLRLDLGLTQEDAARTLGVDVRTYRRYESGEVNEGRGFSVRHPSRRRFLDALEREFGASREELVLEETAEPAPASDTPAPESPAPPRLRLEHALQPAPHFVGRADLCARIAEWTAAPAPDARVLALVGVGGAGKTALAERAARALAERPGASGLVWSFYEDPRVEAFLLAALRAFARTSEAGEGGRLLRLQEALATGPAHVLVLDGLERVQATGEGPRVRGELLDPTLRRLLRALAAGLGGARALVTTRFPLVDLAAWRGQGLDEVELSTLSPAESVELLRAWGLEGSPDELRRAAARWGGHALSLAVAGSYAATFLGAQSRRLDELQLAEAASEDLLAGRLARLLSEVAGALTPLERDALARLAAFGRGAEPSLLAALAESDDPELAGALAGATQGECERALVRLEQLGLVFRSGALAQAHPFVREHFRALLGAQDQRLHAFEAGRLEALLRDRPGQLPREPAQLDRYEQLLIHLVDARQPEAAWRVYLQSLGGLAHLALDLGALDRGERLLRALSPTGEPEDLDLPPDARSAAAYDWGYFAAARGDLALAERCYLAHEAAAAGEDEWARAFGFALSRRARAHAAWRAGDLPRARARVEEALAAAERIESDFHLLRTQALLGRIAHDQGDLIACDAAFEAVRELEEGEPTARRGLWEAEVWLARGRAAEAEAHLRRNLAECAAQGWRGHVAHGRTLLGRALLAQGAEPEAADQLELARAWAREAGEVDVLLRVYDLAARLGEAGAAPAGLALAESTDHGLWRIKFLRLLGQDERAAALAESVGFLG